MSGLLEVLGSQLGGNFISQISSQLGADQAKTENAMSAALPTILGALARNAQTPQGAEALLGALKRDHDGSVLNDLSGLASGQRQADGDGILKHLLGQRRGAVEQNLSKASGLDSGATGKLMSMLAPAVMGALGKQQRTGGLDASALAGFLGQQNQIVEQKAPKQAGLIGKLLDTDGDGDVDMADMLKHGMKLFKR